MKLSIVIPAYNEEKRIAAVIEKYTSYYGKKYGRDFELIVVIDGDDRTLEICKKYKGVRTDHSPVGRGKGGAIRRGFEMAKGEFIGFTDADESVPPEEFEKMLTGEHCAIASRRAKGAKISREQPIRRRAASRAFNMIVNGMFSLGITDTQCGAKVISREALDATLPELRSRGFEFDVELLWRIRKAGFEINEVPISWGHESGSSFSLKAAPSMFFSLVRLRMS